MGKYPVTILIPMYCTTREALEWFRQCLESAMTQDCDVVVYDDGSDWPYAIPIPDGCKFIIGKGNKGPAYARNRAAEVAETELLFPLDCDDVLSPGAIAELHGAWNGKPVYPDVYKFGTQNISHFRLLDWSCKLQYEKLGIASVNVLHSKEQWKAIGGWDESFTKEDLYEDAEYNARLFLTYCAVPLHKPLVGYRQHGTQRTADRANAARQVDGMLRRIGEYEMACCGKKRKSPSNAPTPSYQTAGAITSIAQAMETTLPGQDGDKVLALYTGGRGKMAHYYRGVWSKYPYKVQYGDLLHVDPRDVREEADTNSKSSFIRVPKDDAKKAEAVKAEPQRSARQQPPARQPMPEELLVDISKMAVGAIENEDWAPEDAKRLLAVEKAGKNRARAVAHLTRLANAG